MSSLRSPGGQCSAAIELDRKAIAEATSKPSAAIKLKKHGVTCKLDHKDRKEGTPTRVGGKHRRKIKLLQYRNGRV